MNPTTLDSLSHWLLRTSFEASLLILAVLALRWVFGKRLTPAWRIGLWVVVGVKLLLPAFIPAGFGLGQWWKAPQPFAAETVTVQPAPALPLEAPKLHLTAAEAVMEVPEHRMQWKKLLLGVWAAGALSILLAGVARQWRFSHMLGSRPLAKDARLRQMLDRLTRLAGVGTSVPVLLMPVGTTPAVVGFYRARLLLPEDWAARFDDESLRHVLLHELLHVRHRDLLWNWAALLVQSIHWFNPLVWLVVARFQADRELRCDAGALALLSPEERLAYGHTLLRVQQTFFAPPTVAGLAPCVRNHPTLRQRILMIAEPHRNRPWLQSVFAAAFGVMTGYAFTTVGAAEKEKELPPKERTRETARGARESEAVGNTVREVIETLAPKGVMVTKFQMGPGETLEIEGEGESIGRVIEFREAVISNESLKSYAWNMPPPTVRADGTATFQMEGLAAGGKDEMREGVREGERARDGDKPRTGERDGDKPRTGERDGDKPRTGERDGGDKPRTGERDGGGKVPVLGDIPVVGELFTKGKRDGDQPRTDGRAADKPRTGARDGEGARTGLRDGERKSEARGGDGGRSRESGGTKTSDGDGTSLVLRITDGGESVRVGGETVPMNRLRGFLQGYLPDHAGAKVIVTGDPDVPYKSLTGTVDAVRDNGNKNVSIQAP